MVWSFLAFLSLFVVIGVSSFFFSRGTKKDYYLASSNISPALVGLSAVATNNSGYMFIGVIGYTYATGLASFWLMIGWIVGDFLASTYVHSRLRHATQHSGETSYAGVLSNWFGQHNLLQQRLIALISLIFLMAYAGAQLVAGSKALQVLFDWPAYSGAVLGAALVTVYCFAGGIRASIWTDAAQSLVMIVSMGLLLLVAVSALGGMQSAIGEMAKVDGFLNWFPQDLVLPGIAGALLFALSWMFAGFSVIGQPHIMVRFMALNDNNNMTKARIWYYSWFVLFYAMATGVGMLSRVYLGDPAAFDAELALPTLAQQLLNPVLVGLILAGIFAATMSTTDSVVLSCSAALTHDLIPHKIERPILLKLSTIFIVFIALLWALSSQESVFSLVIMAWSGLASGFAPLLLMLCLGAKPTQRHAIAAIVLGLLVALWWRWMGWHTAVYEGLPGIMAGLLILSPAWLRSRHSTV